MMKDVYSSEGYREYLEQILAARGARSGFRTKMAQALGCHSAYITKIARHGAPLSLEQAERLNRFLGHSSEESHFFLTLVQRDRAGTRELRRYFDDQLVALRSRRTSIQRRLAVRQEIPQEAHSIYFSSWKYGAVHVALSIPALRTKDAIARYLGISMTQVSEALEFLESCGLVKADGAGFAQLSTNVHLSAGSPHIGKHHTNWRTQAIVSLDGDASDDMHYSAVVTLSRKDAFRVKDFLIQAIKQSQDVIRDSPEEEIYCIAADFFSMKRGS